MMNKVNSSVKYSDTFLYHHFKAESGESSIKLKVSLSQKHLSVRGYCAGGFIGKRTLIIYLTYNNST